MVSFQINFKVLKFNHFFLIRFIEIHKFFKFKNQILLLTTTPATNDFVGNLFDLLKDADHNNQVLKEKLRRMTGGNRASMDEEFDDEQRNPKHARYEPHVGERNPKHARYEHYDSRRISPDKDRDSRRRYFLYMM